MKKCILLLVCAAASVVAMAQTIKTVGTTGADYATLKAAFDKINDATLASPIELQIIDNTTETAPAVLSKVGAAVTIYPTVTGKSISGAVAGNLIQLGSGNNNVVSNVIIDGRLRNSSGVITGSTPDLTIENTDNGTSTSTILFNTGSNGYVKDSKVTYCIIKGSSQRAENSGGMIHINGGHASQTGIEISYNKIKASNGVRPTNAVWVGNNTAPTKDVKIQNNHFEDVVKSNGIRILNYALNIDISGNSFYETAAFTPTVAYNFIQGAGSGSLGLNGVISNNYLGGSGPECDGMMTTTGSFNLAFRPININNIQTRDGITISNNIIKNITWTNNGNKPAFNGIYFQGHLNSNAPNTISNIHSNFISNITFSTTADSYCDIFGINYAGKNVNIYNNIIDLGSNHRANVSGIRLSAGAYDVNNIVNVYNNTVYIQGEQPASGNENSYAFNNAPTGSTPNSYTRDIRNNIFYNARTRLGGSGKHYAFYLNYTAMVPDPNTNNVSFTCNNNSYYATGAGKVLGYVGADKATLSDIQAATGQDGNSSDLTPGITAGITPESFKGTVALTGADLSALIGNKDFAGDTRKTLTQMGAYFVPGILSVSSDKNISELTLTTSSQIEVGAGATLTLNQAMGTEISKIVVNPTGKLSLGSNAVTATNGIVLKSDATGTATLTGDNAVSNATVQQYVTAGRNWYVSPSVSSATYSTLSRGTSVVEWNEATKAWDTKSSGTLTAGRGYIQVATSTPSVTGTTGTVNFTGTTNAGDIPVTVTRTESGSSRGFNLVGNPYPSYLKWDDFYAESGNAAAVLNSFWFRTLNNSDQYVFTTYNGASHEVVGGSEVPTDLNNFIPPMQAFWVRVKQNMNTGDVNYPNNVASITFKNNMRGHIDAAGNTSNNKFKAPKDDERRSLRLQLSNGNFTDESLIYFDANAANDFDDYDSPKMMNNSTLMPDIYSKSGSEKVVINGLNAVSDNLELPLGFTLKAASTGLKLKVSELSNFSADTKVYLQDKVLNTQTELTANAEYSFDLSEATVNNESRFSLLFRTPNAPTALNNPESHNAQVFVNAANQITIVAPVNSQYAIYNAVGLLLKRGVTNTSSEIPNQMLVQGVYFVEISVNGMHEIKKVIIR